MAGNINAKIASHQNFCKILRVIDRIKVFFNGWIKWIFQKRQFVSALHSAGANSLTSRAYVKPYVGPESDIVTNVVSYKLLKNIF